MIYQRARNKVFSENKRVPWVKICWNFTHIEVSGAVLMYAFSISARCYLKTLQPNVIALFYI